MSAASVARGLSLPLGEQVGDRQSWHPPWDGLAGDRELLFGARGDRLQRADGRLDVARRRTGSAAASAGSAMYSRRLRWTASPAVVRSTCASPRISPSASSRASSSRVESASRFGEPARSSLSASRSSAGPRVAISCRAYQVSGVGLALGEVPAQHGGQGALGEGQGLAELGEGVGWCGHVRLRSHRIDRCLTTVANRQVPVYLMEANFPARPLIGLLLRLLYQHYSQDIDAALREAGFGDIRPAHANVFPFVPPDGITVSELAELARVRKQTMAQAVDQLERMGYVERRPNPQRPPLAAGLPHRARRGGQAGHARDRRARRGALGAADEPGGARGAARLAAAPADRAQGPVGPGVRSAGDASHTRISSARAAGAS